MEHYEGVTWKVLVLGFSTVLRVCDRLKSRKTFAGILTFQAGVAP